MTDERFRVVADEAVYITQPAPSAGTRTVAPEDERFRVLAEETVLIGLPAGAPGPIGPQGPPGPQGDPGTADGAWHPDGHGLLTWAYDPSLVSAQYAATAGTMYATRLRLPAAATVTGVFLYAIAAGAGLTANGCYAALYRATGELIGATADQSALWASVGGKKMPLTGGPYPLAAGDYYVAHYGNGTTMPQWGRVSSAGPLVNINLPAAEPRYGASAGGYTGAPPEPLPALAQTASIWAAMY